MSSQDRNDHFCSKTILKMQRQPTRMQRRRQYLQARHRNTANGFVHLCVFVFVHSYSAFNSAHIMRLPAGPASLSQAHSRQRYRGFKTWPPKMEGSEGSLFVCGAMCKYIGVLVNYTDMPSFL